MGAACGHVAPLRAAFFFTAVALALSVAATLSPAWVSWRGETLGLWHHCPGGDAPCTSPPCSDDGALGTCVARDAACACTVVACVASFCSLALGGRALRLVGGRRAGEGAGPPLTARAFPAMLALSCVLVGGQLASFLCYLLGTVRALHLGWGAYLAFSAIPCWALAVATSGVSVCGCFRRCLRRSSSDGGGGHESGGDHGRSADDSWKGAAVRQMSRGRQAQDPSFSTTTMTTTTTVVNYNSASSATIFALENAWRPGPDMQLMVKLPRLRVQTQQQQPQQQENAMKRKSYRGDGDDSCGAGDYADVEHEDNEYEHADWPHHTTAPTMTSARANITLTRADLPATIGRALPELPALPGCARGPSGLGSEGLSGPCPGGPEGWVYENLYGELDYGYSERFRPQGPPVVQRVETQRSGAALGCATGLEWGSSSETYNMYY